MKAHESKNVKSVVNSLIVEKLYSSCNYENLRYSRGNMCTYMTHKVYVKQAKIYTNLHLS